MTKMALIYSYCSVRYGNRCVKHSQYIIHYTSIKCINIRLSKLHNVDLEKVNKIIRIENNLENYKAKI